MADACFASALGKFIVGVDRAFSHSRKNDGLSFSQSRVHAETGCPLTAGGVAGVHRRHERRLVRRCAAEVTCPHLPRGRCTRSIDFRISAGLVADGVAAVPFPLIFIRDPKSQFRLPSLINNVRAAAKDPEASHSLRIHLQMLDLPAGTNQTQSAPENCRH